MKYIMYVVFVGAVVGAGYYHYFYNTPIAPTQSPAIAEEVPIVQNSNLISITSPQANAQISNPVSVSGQARGYWFFEASAPVIVVDWNNNTIGSGVITATGDWMTENFVPFTGSISYTLPPNSTGQSGKIIFKRDNPSDLPQNDASSVVPIKF